ncbi:RNA-directed DNA polymerase [Sediminicoccus rosea]|uniref:RNA-directed DNA polymerase n=1 Tax=Sediminicoccus rosea TaxID=1225128 RepID=A0ABZ0PPK7_9PROT|nr:RNA-directed DNA polymerase [Sediminicoccus rosea]WPB87470.1 RNA-directed DNA polymerase [Sediminicoccus rosea]
MRLNRSQRLRRFLEAGYLAEELPPPFVSYSFARVRGALLTEWKAATDFPKFRSRPEQFTIPRYASARRRISIPNPINFFRLSSEIANGWNEIRDFLASSKITEFRPIIDAEGPRSIFKLDFDLVGQRQAQILADYDFVFKTDISRFYPSIYTHSIPWALYGKIWVKENHKTKKFKDSLGDKLDFELRKGQEDQSIGIPIGPDTSRILSEIVAIGLERELKPLLSDLDRRSVRYVDDILIGFDEFESEDKISAVLEGAVAHFELDININKTKILGKRGVETFEWITELRACSVRNVTPKAQRDDLERFFKLALFYASTNEKDAVLKWAMKRSRSFDVLKDNSNFYCDYMLRLCRKSLSTLPILSQMLIEAKSNGWPIPSDRINKFISDILMIHAPIGHAFEVSWALFLAKGLRIKLYKEKMSDVFKIESSLCALICMDLNARGLIDGGVDESYWLLYANEQGLRSPMWLLSYEAARKKWWSDGRYKYVEKHSLFGPMLKRGVFFYDENRNVPRLRSELQRAKRQRIRTAKIFRNWVDYM